MADFDKTVTQPIAVPMLILALALMALLSASASAQMQRAPNAVNIAPARIEPLPEPLLKRSQTIHAALKPSAAAWVLQQAKVEGQRSTPDLGSLQAAIRQRFGGSLAGSDIDALAFAVMSDAANDANSDLQATMNDMQAQTKAKQSLRSLLDAANTEAAAAKSRPANASCVSAFCSSLPARLAELAAATASAPKPVRLQAPADLTNRQLDAVQAQLKDALDSMSEMSETTSLRLQMLMDRRAKIVETLSNIAKKMSDTNASVVSNLK